MESKRQIDQGGNTRNTVRWPSSQVANSPLRNLPITQSVFGPAARPLAARLSAGF
jgi:hypothetical protein